MTFLLSIIKELDADWTKVQTLILANKLGEDIEYRIHHYTKCISKSTTNFADWLKDDYGKKLRLYLRDNFDTVFEEVYGRLPED